MTEYDEITKSKHYNTSGIIHSKCGGEIECIDVVRAFQMDLGNGIKYIWRNGKKDDAVADLNKAIYYIKDHIENVLGGVCSYEEVGKSGGSRSGDSGVLHPPSASLTLFPDQHR